MGIAARYGLVLGVFLAVTAGLQSCSLLPGTRVDATNPQLVGTEDQPYAKVYFIRPRTERSMAEADNELTVDLDHQRLLTLVKGEYTLAKLKPGKVTLTVTSTTSMYIKTPTLHRISRSRDFEFAPGKTYYIVMQMVNGEFRGVYNVPVQVEGMKASRIVKYLRPVGKAKHDPINPA